MPEEQKTVKLPPLPSMTISRNSTNGNFVNGEVLRGDSKGSQYLKLEVSEANFTSVIVPWIGLTDLVKIVDAIMRQRAQTWWEEATDSATNKDSGEVDNAKRLELFSSYASTFSSRGESIPALEGQVEEYVTLMSELDPETMDAAEFGKKFKEYTVEIKRLQSEIGNKRRERKAKSEANEASK